MTRQNRQANVELEWARAARAVREVDALMAQELWEASVSRAYYGMFHAARALAFTEGLESKTHAGLIHLLSVSLVRPGRFPADMILLLSQAQRLRQDADYETAVVFDGDSAREARDGLVRFQHACEEFLRQAGFL